MRTRLAYVAILLSSASSVVAQQPAPSSTSITIHAPDEERLEIALDEIELRWVNADGSVNEQKRVVTTPSSSSVIDAGTHARSLEKENSGAEAFLVLYETGRPRTVATRRLLGREVAIILDDSADPGAIAKTLAHLRPRLVAPRAFVVHAPDPLASLALAEQLRQTPGIQLAYPLLRRQQFAR